MIHLKLMYDEAPDVRVIKEVKFVDGEAALPDNMVKKAESICKFYNVEVVYDDPEELEEELEELEEPEDVLDGFGDEE